MVEIYFLNVGHGDCSIIKHNSGRITMIDINNADSYDKESEQELLESFDLRQTSILWDPMYRLREKGYAIQTTNPIEFFKKNFQNENIFRYIQSHPDLDHMRGLGELSKTGISIINFWDTENDRSIEEEMTEYDKESWEEYQRYRMGRGVRSVLKLYRGSKGIYYNQEPVGVPPGDGLEILSPTKGIANGANELQKWNNLSYVLRLAYKGKRIIFAGDAEKEVWDDLVDQYDSDLKCDVLKASHHGRDTGYHAEALKRMNPRYAIVSVGKKPENDASNKYRNYSDHVWSTRWKGNIKVTINDSGSLSISSEG
jgi:beta-lactamase superfamily II metal-dependent hydrolase